MRPNTLSKVAHRLATETLDKALPEFLDEFYAAKSDEHRYHMLAQQPDRTGNQRHDALIAATAHYLAHRYRLNPQPSWYNEPNYILAKPWHTTESSDPALIEYLTFASPAEFRCRNIFTDEAPLRRKSGPIVRRPTETA